MSSGGSNDGALDWTAAMSLSASNFTIGGGRVDGSFSHPLRPPDSYQDFTYPSSLDFPHSMNHARSSPSAGGSWFPSLFPSSSAPSVLPSMPPPPPPAPIDHDDDGVDNPLLDSTEHSLFSTFLTTLDIDPKFLFNPVLPPGMPSPPSLELAPGGGGHEERVYDRDRHERDLLGETLSSRLGFESSSSSSNLLYPSYRPREANVPLRHDSVSDPTYLPTALDQDDDDSDHDRVEANDAPEDERDDEVDNDRDGDYEPSSSTTTTRRRKSRSGGVSGRATALDRERGGKKMRTSPEREPIGRDDDAAMLTVAGRGARRRGEQGQDQDEAEGKGEGEGEEVEGEGEEAEAEKDDDPDYAEQAVRTRGGGGGGATGTSSKQRNGGGVVTLATTRSKRARPPSTAASSRRNSHSSSSNAPLTSTTYGFPTHHDDNDDEQQQLGGPVDDVVVGISSSSSLSSSTATATTKPTRAGRPAAAAAAKPQTHHNNNNNLSHTQKRQNHIESEQRRRNAIKLNFKDLVELVIRGQSLSGVILGASVTDEQDDTTTPAATTTMGGDGGSEDETTEQGGGRGRSGVKRRAAAAATTKRGKKAIGAPPAPGRGRGRKGDTGANASKSVVLERARDYICWLERGNRALERELARVQHSLV